MAPSTGNTGESETDGKEFYNGHTFEVEGVGSPTIVFDGITYTLAQFHTHTPSEHKVAGRHYDMEMHFVHKAVVDGVTKLAVVGCFFEKGDRSPTFIKELMETVPKLTAAPTELAPTLDFRVSFPSSPHFALLPHVCGRWEARRDRRAHNCGLDRRHRAAS